MTKKYKLTITMTQETDGEVDNKTLVEEYSNDGAVHVVKAKAFVQAMNDATQGLMSMAIGGTTKTDKTPDPNFVR